MHIPKNVKRGLIGVASLACEAIDCENTTEEASQEEIEAAFEWLAQITLPSDEDFARAGREIHAIMSGKEWTADTLPDIADAFERNGISVEES